MQTYVLAMESSGARTVPLFCDGDIDEELAKVDNLNGILFCGGDNQDDYVAFGKQVYDKVKSINDNG